MTERHRVVPSFGSIAGLRAVLLVVVALGASAPAWADSAKRERVTPLFGLGAPSEGPFPADRFTIVDPTQNTCERVALPKPDCAQQRNECVEIDEVNKLDGFNPRTRLAIPFSGPIDLATVGSSTIFLLSLGDAMTNGAPSCTTPARGDCRLRGDDDVEGCEPASPGAGQIVGIDQGVWDPETNTLYAESAQLLRQHTRYAMIVTRGVHDTRGDEIEASREFVRAISDDEDGPADPNLAAYRASLRRAVAQARLAGIHRHDIVAASVFTTVSVTAVMEKMRDFVQASPAPAPARFDLGPNGERTVFTRSAVTKVVQNSQTKVNGPVSSNDITPRLFSVLNIVPNAVSQIAYGKFQSPFFLNPDTTMAPIATFSGAPLPTGSADIYFNLFIPTGTKPAAGWPVAVWSYGTGDSKDGSPYVIAAELAAHGLATLSINIVGHGFGPRSTISITLNGAPQPTLTFPTGGRAVDVNGDGNFANNEGSQAVGDLRFLVQNRDAMRQGVADYEQLIHVIEAGVDYDGDGFRDLDPSRIYFSGFSLTSSWVCDLFVIEPKVRAATLTGIGSGPSPQLLPPNRGNLALFLQSRVPSLINPAGATVVTSIGGIATTPPFFNENIPERGQPVLVNTVPGALPLQAFLDRAEWVQATTAPGTYGRYLRSSPLPGVPTRPFIVHLARGDQQIANTGTAEFIRSGDFADRVTIYRHDLFPQTLLPQSCVTAASSVLNGCKNPHAFVARTLPDIPALNFVGLEAQDQIGEFFASDGLSTKDPDGAGPLFEVPASFIPTDLGFILP